MALAGCATPHPVRKAPPGSAEIQPRASGAAEGTVDGVPGAILERAATALQAQGLTLSVLPGPSGMTEATGDGAVDPRWADCPTITVRDPFSEALRSRRKNAAEMTTRVTVSTAAATPATVTRSASRTRNPIRTTSPSCVTSSMRPRSLRTCAALACAESAVASGSAAYESIRAPTRSRNCSAAAATCFGSYPMRSRALRALAMPASTSSSKPLTSDSAGAPLAATAERNALATEPAGSAMFHSRIVPSRPAVTSSRPPPTTRTAYASWTCPRNTTSRGLHCDHNSFHVNSRRSG